MPLEKSAGAVIFYNHKNNIEYLLLHYPGMKDKNKDYWDFPKGHIENGETELETVRREIKEETGLENLEIIPGFKKTIRYFFRKDGKNVLKLVVFYLAKTDTKEIVISPEHIGYCWVSLEEALNLMKFKNSKEVLKEAHNFLLNSNKNEI